MINSVRHSFEYNTAVIFKKLQFCFLSVWLIASIGISAWGVWPGVLESRDLFIPGLGLLYLEWKPENRTGDISIVELTLVTQNEQSKSVAPHQTSIASYSPVLQHPEVNVEKRVRRFLEARLEIPAVDMKPRNAVEQSFQPGDQVVFYWNVNSLAEGEYQGRVWVYTGSQSSAGDVGNKYPIAVQSVDFQWRNLFGLSGMAARYVGLIGLFLGIILMLTLWFQSRHMRA